jgi:filamentous hemagglutinin
MVRIVTYAYCDRTPFLDAAIQRGDDIVLATKPEQRFLTRLASDGSGAIETTGFGKEYEYLKMQGYVYEAKTGKMIRSVK